MKLVITRGLPGSGKTTYARACVSEDPQRRARVNRDDLRAMMHQSVYIPADSDDPGTERAIIAAQHAAVSALLNRGLDVIVDDTSLPSRTVRDLRRLAVLAGADFEVVDFTNVPLDECLRRNAARDKVVPEEFIRDLHRRYIKGKPYPLPIPDDPDTETRGAPYEPKPGTPQTILVDIDGTVALMGTRSPFDESRVHEDLLAALVKVSPDEAERVCEELEWLMDGEGLAEWVGEEAHRRGIDIEALVAAAEERAKAHAAKRAEATS